MTRQVLALLLEASQRGRPAVLTTRLADGSQSVLHPFEKESADVSADLFEAARQALLADRSRLASTQSGEVFLKVYNLPLRMLVVGAVHIAQALAPIAALAGFHVIVIDPRGAFATDDRFPRVELLRRWPEEALQELEIDHRTAVVTLSHDPKLDDPALSAALRSQAFYIGALGSRRTHARRVARLVEAGFTDEQVGRVHAPVGLDIGAHTPAEIAVAIAAQAVDRLRR